MQQQAEPQKKPSLKKFIIAVLVIFCLLAGYIYKVVIRL